MICLFCGRELDRSRCACGAAWLDEPTLAGALADLDPPWQPRSGTLRPCPACKTSMATVSLAGIALDRCDKHGVWFDPGELALVLTHAESPRYTAVAVDDAAMLHDPVARAGFDDKFLEGHGPERFVAGRILERLARILRIG